MQIVNNQGSLVDIFFPIIFNKDVLKGKFVNYKPKFNIMGIKPGPKRIAKSTGQPDKRQRDNKDTPKNTPSLKPHKHKPND